jgi:flagellar basal body rod protein FlgG
MPYGLYLSAEGAHVQSIRLETLANNLANVDTPGFKRDLAVFQARYSEAEQRGLEAPGNGGFSDLSGGTMVRETRTDFAPGMLKPTHNDKDFAIDGQGFFAIKRGDETLLTRAGNFLINSNNQLVTQNGDAVLNDSLNPITIDPTLPWTLANDGTIQQAGDVTPLGVVKPASLGDLVKMGDNLFRSLGPVTPTDPTERHVLNNTLEGSGVKPTLEMMELIETTRAFEANVNMIKTQDTAMSGLISRLLKE